MERESHKRKEEVRVHFHVMPRDHHLTVSVAPVPVPRQMRQDPFSVPLPATEKFKISRFSDLKLILKSATDFFACSFLNRFGKFYFNQVVFFFVFFVNHHLTSNPVNHESV